MLPTTGVNLVENPDHAYSVLNRILPNYNVMRGTDAAAEAIEHTDQLGNVHRAKPIEEVMERIRNLTPYGSKTESYQAMKDYADYLFVHTARETGAD